MLFFTQDVILCLLRKKQQFLVKHYWCKREPYSMFLKALKVAKAASWDQESLFVLKSTLQFRTAEAAVARYELLFPLPFFDIFNFKAFDF